MDNVIERFHKAFFPGVQSEWCIESSVIDPVVFSDVSGIFVGAEVSHCWLQGV